MTNTEYLHKLDFLCEKRLHQTDEPLHQRFRNSMFVIDQLLINYKGVFPYYTDHTMLHSEQVINYCNIIAGEEIVETLNPDELYILLMGAALHDVGMGVSRRDFDVMSGKIDGLTLYRNTHPNESDAECIRAFHQDFSAQFIRKYSRLLEIPSEEYVYCIGQVVKGHRNADLLDEALYPTDYELSDGNKVNLAYLSALVKLADELDLTADRNLFYDYQNIDESYSEKTILCLKSHSATKRLDVRFDSLVYLYQTDEESVQQEILSLSRKVDKTFSEYLDVVAQRTPFRQRIRTITFENVPCVETDCLSTQESTTHRMKLNPEPFELIKSGKKTIELRLFDGKRQIIKVGDSIVFTHALTGEKLRVNVENLHRFESFEELYKSLPLLKCGYTEATVADAKPSDMEEYYSAEDQKKYGVVGIEISLHSEHEERTQGDGSSVLTSDDNDI